MTHLFPEIIADILCRLPVKSLLRFRCVSKSWGNQIDDPYFIKLHLNHSLKTNTNLTLILTQYYKENLFSVDLDTLHTAIKLNNPIEEGGVTQVLGSCNGLVALLNSNTNIALWNPSTRTYHKLPAMPLEMLGGFSNSIDYGFGYDPVSDDYKLVRIVPYDYWKKPQVEIYSLKSNSWRRTRDFPYCRWYDTPRNGTLANNTLHWRVTAKSERDYRTLIVAFDLRVEEYFEVPQFDFIQKNIHYLSLESLGGCLCVVCHYHNVSVDIWVMKEYRVKESWIKVFSIQRDMILKPLAYSKSGDKVLLNQYNDEKFVWYDLRSKRTEKVRILGAPTLFEVKMCVASLVPLNGGQQAGGN